MTPRTMRRIYSREAAVVLAAARLAVRLLPSAWLFAWADRAPRRICRFAGDEADWVAWAVERAGLRTGSPCLPRALAAHAMLRRRGIVSRLCLGVARNGCDVAAHAWIEVGERKIVGGDESRSFTRLAAFGVK